MWVLSALEALCCSLHDFHGFGVGGAVAVDKGITIYTFFSAFPLCIHLSS